MRIKFRAWDAYDESMHNNVIPMYSKERLINVIFEWENSGYNFCEIDINNYDNAYLYEEFPYEVMQYTGLRDVNSVEIYEGDVVKVNYNDVSEVKIITYHNASFGFRDNEMGFVPLAIFERPSKNLIVIGNIYENPELLGDNQ